MTPLFTIEDIRRIYGADPKNLPDLYVHDDHTWRGGARVDAKGRLHMNQSQLLLIKESLPVHRVGQIGPNTQHFRFALAAHHLMQGGGEQKPVNDNARQGAVREATGRRAHDAAPKSKSDHTGLVLVKKEDGRPKGEGSQL